MRRRKSKEAIGADRLTITLGSGQRELLEAIARQNQASLAFVARQMLADFIKAHRNDQLRLSFTGTSNDSKRK